MTRTNENDTMPNILVTGGGGFIGSHLATRFVELGHAVRVIDNFSTGRRANLAHLGSRVEILEADIRRPEDCLRACDDVDYVFHQAALPSVPKSVADPVASHETNISGTLFLLQAAVRCKVRRFIYAASSSAYGDKDESPKHEEMSPAPLSPYAVQKLAGEHYCRAFCECYGLDTLSIRYFNVFGPRQDPASQYAAAIPAFVTAILRGTPPTVYGDGEQTRDFTYIENVVHGNVRAMEVARCGGGTINLACGQAVTVNAVIAAINDLLGARVAPKHVDPRPGDVRHSCASIERARRQLGYSPIVSFEEGLRRAIDYYKSL
jgi:UDP-glucose 4-epimerase